MPTTNRTSPVANAIQPYCSFRFNSEKYSVTARTQRFTASFNRSFSICKSILRTLSLHDSCDVTPVQIVRWMLHVLHEYVSNREFPLFNVFVFVIGALHKSHNGAPMIKPRNQPSSRTRV